MLKVKASGILMISAILGSEQARRFLTSVTAREAMMKDAPVNLFGLKLINS